MGAALFRHIGCACPAPRGTITMELQGNCLHVIFSFYVDICDSTGLQKEPDTQWMYLLTLSVPQ